MLTAAYRPVGGLLAIGMMLASASLPAAGQPAPAEKFRERVTFAQAKLATTLMQRLARPRKHMITISPASVAGVAAALDLGASEQLRDSLHKVLGFRADADATADFIALRATMAGLTASGGDKSPIRYFNAVLFDESLTLYPGVALAFRQAELDQSQVDFGDPRTADKINDKVRQQTGGLIPEIVERTPGNTSLLALNALYFKDRWKTPFDAADTKPAPFRRVGMRPEPVSMMQLPEGRYRFRRDARFAGVELPYSDGRFSMIIVTTRSERAAPVSRFRPAAAWLAGEGFTEQQGDVALPRFDVSSREDLTGSLDALGLRAVRRRPDALSGFSPDPLRITRVFQRVELRVTEEGTEAAAATAAIAERGGTEDFVHLVMDRPFVFALRDSATGLILAAGYVGDPAPLATAKR